MSVPSPASPPVADTAIWFQDWLADLRARGGAWSRESFAAAVGCEPCHLSNLLAGRRGLSAEHALGVALAAELDLEAAEWLLAVAARERVAPADEEAVGQAEEAIAVAGEALRARAALGEAGPPPVPPDAMAALVPVLRHACGPSRPIPELAQALLPPAPPRALAPGFDAPPAPRWRASGMNDAPGAQAAMLGRLPWLVHRRSTRQQESRALLWALPRAGLPEVMAAVRALLSAPLEALVARRGRDRTLVQIGAWMWPISEVVPPLPDRPVWRPPASPQPAAALGVPILAYDHPAAWLREVLGRWVGARKGRTVAGFARQAEIPLSTLYAMTDPRRSFAARHAPRLAGELGLGLDGLDDLTLLMAIQGQGRYDVRARDRLAERRLSRGIVDPERDGWVAMTRLDWLTVLELAALPGFVPDPAWIAATVRPRQTPTQAATALDSLVKLGFLGVGSDGVPRPTGMVLQTPDKLPRLQACRLIWRCALQARVRLAEGLEPPVGDAEASYVSVLEEDVEEVLGLVRNARERITALLQQLSEENQPDQVFSLLLHGACLTRTLGVPSTS